MITYQVETWEQYRAGCDALWMEHYEEIAADKDRMPMRPDIKRFEALEAEGQLQVLVAREAGKMVGYAVFIVSPHPHYADVLCGFEDAYFLTKSLRKGWTGIKLLRESIRLLKSRGVKRVFVHTKKHKDLGAVLRHLGLSHSDEIYSGWIGD